MRDQAEFVVDDFRGYWDRTALYPKGYGQAYNDCRFKDGTVYVREPVDQTFSLAALTFGGAESIKRIFPFRLSSAPFTVRYLVHTYDGVTGRIRDTGAGAPATPILSKAGMQDFWLQILFDRAYITPNGAARGLASEFVYVYDPSKTTTARKAAGLKPATFLTPAVGAAGNCTPGFHLVTYAHETDSGFVTKYTTPAGVTVPAGTPSIITLTGVAVGPTGTVARRILMTKFITNYDGNPDHYEFFFAGTINDNVTTTGNINLYDTQLVSSGAYLLDQLEEIPAALGIGQYLGSMTTWNDATDANDSLVRISKKGEPESFPATDGYLIAGKGEGGRIQNCREYRGTLYIFKGRRTYNAQATDGPASTWPVNTVDDNKGTTKLGIAEVVDATGNSLDFLLIECLDGLYPFDGKYPDIPLTYALENSMRLTYSKNSGKTHLCVDPVTKRIFIAFGSDATTGYHLWSVDYSQGLTYEKVRWARWAPIAIGGANKITGVQSMHIEPVQVAGQETARLIMADSVNTASLKGIILNEAVPTIGDVDFGGTSQDISFQVGIGSIEFGSGVNSFNGFRLRGFMGSDTQATYIFDFALFDSITGLSSGTGNYIYRLTNYVSERIRTLDFVRTAKDYSDFQFATNFVEQLIIYGKPIWQSRAM